MNGGTGDSGPRPRVLVVDDEATTCRMLGDMLGWLGLEAEASVHPSEALVRLHGDAGWDLLVTDLLMPETSGWDLVAAARALDPHLKVLLITGRPSAAVLERARQAGLCLLPKPFTMAALAAAVREALARDSQPTV